MWRAYDTGLDRAVTITILRADLAADEQSRAAWRDQARTTPSTPGLEVVDYGECVPEPVHNGDPVVAYRVQLLSPDEWDLGDPGEVPAPVSPHRPPSLAVARE